MMKWTTFYMLAAGAAFALTVAAPDSAQACYGCGPQAYPVVQQVAVPVPYPVVQRVAVPVPQPYPVIQRVAVPVPQPYPVVVGRVAHPVYVPRCGDGLLNVIFGACGPRYAYHGACGACGVAETPYVVDQGPVISGAGITRAPTYIPPRRFYREPVLRRDVYHRGYHAQRIAPRHVSRRAAAPAVRRTRLSADGQVFNARAHVRVINKKRVDIRLYRY